MLYLKQFTHKFGLDCAKEDRVHKDALSQLIANSEAEMNAIFFTDYFPYRKNNAILSEKISYNTNAYPIIQQFLQNCRLLQIAVLTDKITITQHEMGINVGTDDNAINVLAKLLDQIQEPLSLLDDLLTRIDQLCHERYNWVQIKDDVIKRIPDNQTDALEHFLEKK